MKMSNNKHLLNPPLFNRDSREDRNNCSKENLPYAVFLKRGKYGEYTCDLILIHGLKLSDEGTSMINGVVEAMLARWFIDGKIPKRKSVYWNNGPIYISIWPCPIGEEVYLHRAICRVLTSCMVQTNI